MPDIQQNWKPRIPSAVQAQVTEAEKLEKPQSVVNNPDIKTPEQVARENEQPPEDSAVSRYTVENETPIPEGNWEQKYQSLAGKFDAQDRRQKEEIDRLHGQLAQMNDTVAALNAAISKGLSGNNAPAERQPEQVLDDDIDKINLEELGDLSDELPKLTEILKRDREQYRSLQREIAELRNSTSTVASDVAASRETNFNQFMDKNAPGWREINPSPEFAEFLGVKSFNDDSPMLMKLRDAATRGDGPAAAAFFHDFLRWREYKGQPWKSNSPQEPQQGIESLVVPEPGRGVDESGRRANHPVITTEQYNRATKDAINHRISKEDFEKISRIYQQCVSEGLVRP